MYLTEKEILDQYSALRKTFEYMNKIKAEIEDFSKESSYKTIIFLGCGSSYSICQSAQLSAIINLDLPAYALPAGDLMLNFPFYQNLIKDSLIVALSRSGSTSELINAIKKAQKDYDTTLISITAGEDSKLAKMADLKIELPWAFDESVCQTRTVTNLYTANLILLALMAENENLMKEIKETIDGGETFIDYYEEDLRKIGSELDFERVVVLADAELKGIADEAALAFKEISQLNSNYYHLLDVRHGPLVMINEKTLVIMVMSPFESKYQIDLIKDIKRKKSPTITVGSQENISIADYHFKVNKFKNYAVTGLPFIFIAQLISLSKALALGVNPDLPTGLDSWIEL